MATTVRAERSVTERLYHSQGLAQRCRVRTLECAMRMTEVELTAAQSLQAASLSLCREPSRTGSGATSPNALTWAEEGSGDTW